MIFSDFSTDCHEMLQIIFLDALLASLKILMKILKSVKLDYSTNNY